MRTIWQIEIEYFVNWKIIMADKSQLWQNINFDIVLFMNDKMLLEKPTMNNTKVEMINYLNQENAIQIFRT